MDEVLQLQQEYGALAGAIVTMIGAMLAVWKMVRALFRDRTTPEQTELMSGIRRHLNNFRTLKLLEVVQSNGVVGCGGVQTAEMIDKKPLLQVNWYSGEIWVHADQVQKLLTRKQERQVFREAKIALARLQEDERFTSTVLAVNRLTA